MNSAKIRAVGTGLLLLSLLVGCDKNVENQTASTVPEENWLPINRGDMELSLQYRIYEPDAEKMKTWVIPQPEIVRKSGE